MAFDATRTLRGALAGAAAAAVWAAQQPLDKRVFGVDYDDAELLGRLARVRAPVFLMHGDADTLVTPANLERLKRARPDATVVLVAGVGHELAYTVAAQAILVGWINGNIAARP